MERRKKRHSQLVVCPFSFFPPSLTSPFTFSLLSLSKPKNIKGRLYIPLTDLQTHHEK
jgi:hypothetical protein